MKQTLYEVQFQFWLAVLKDEHRAAKAAQQDVETAKQRGL